MSNQCKYDFYLNFSSSLNWACGWPIPQNPDTKFHSSKLDYSDMTKTIFSTFFKLSELISRKNMPLNQFFFENSQKFYCLFSSSQGKLIMVELSFATFAMLCTTADILESFFLHYTCILLFIYAHRHKVVVKQNFEQLWKT